MKSKKIFIAGKKELIVLIFGNGLMKNFQMEYTNTEFKNTHYDY